MDEPATLLILLGTATSVAGGLLRQLHFARIMSYLKDHYPGLSDDIAGGRYRRNPLVFRNRLDALVEDGRLAALQDSELDARIRIYRQVSRAIGLGVVIVILGIALSVIGSLR